MTKPRHCPRCRSTTIFYHEQWFGHTPIAVKATCYDCNHKWKLRNVQSLAEPWKWIEPRCGRQMLN